jgi:hypothetical protein
MPSGFASSRTPPWTPRRVSTSPARAIWATTRARNAGGSPPRSAIWLTGNAPRGAFVSSARAIAASRRSPTTTRSSGSSRSRRSSGAGRDACRARHRPAARAAVAVDHCPEAFGWLRCPLRGRVAELRAPASAAHQRGDLRLRGQRDLRGDLLLDPAALQGADVQRPAEQAALLGLAADHRRRGSRCPSGSRRARSTPSSSGRSTSRSRWSGRASSASTSSGRSQAPRAAHVRRALVLHRDDRHRRDAPHLQQPLDPRGPVHWFKTGRDALDRLAGHEVYPIYAGVQDALMQWWYGHNAVAFFLTTPFLGLMYYFLPKAAKRPVFSYRCRSSTSGRWCSSTSGRARTTCTTPRCPSGPRPWACSSA